MKKSFGIIGAGNIGQAVARHLINAGYQVTLSNSKGIEPLKEIVASLGKNAKAGTAVEAAQQDIVLLALPWSQLPTITKLVDWTDRIVLDATNHFINANFDVADLNGKASSEVVASYLPGAKIVKVFNTLYFKILAADPHEAGGRRVLFLSADDVPSKKEVIGVIESLGFAAVDLGTLAEGSKQQQAKGALAALNLIKL